MRCDVLVIGAGMSGLAAAVRLAQFGRSVVLAERHTLWGGLNSFYKLAGRRFDTGLHALTNYAPPGTRKSPLVRVLRQLGIEQGELRLGQQGHSEIAFRCAGESVRLRFANGPELLRTEVARLFPSDRAGLDALIAKLPPYSAVDGLGEGVPSARASLAEHLREPLLREMLFEPLAFYGGSREQDLDGRDFAVLFRSIYLEGFARPAGGIKTLLDSLVRRLRAAGGELRTGCGVRRLCVEGGAVRGALLDDRSEVECDLVLSCAGGPETLRLVDPAGRHDPASGGRVGALSFLESISVLDREPSALGLGATMTFFNDSPRFEYARPREAVDVRSGVVCAPNNYASDEPMAEGLLRLTVLADPARWKSFPEAVYRAEKEAAADRALASAARFVPDVRPHTVFRDVFTPRTIEQFTGRIDGAVYGSPDKRRDGRTGVGGLHLIGTDQGLVGVVGALVSGVAMADRHALLERSDAR